MKVIKLFLIILTFFIVLNTVSAVRYVNYEFKEGIISNRQLTATNNPVGDVSVVGFVCANVDCSNVSGVLWDGAVLNSGSNSSIQLEYPTQLQSAFGYGIYYFKDGYIPWEQNPNWWGTNSNDPQGPYERILSRKDVCSAPIDRFVVANDVQPNIPLVMSLGAGLDAATHAAIQNAELGYVPPGFEEYYSVETNIRLRIYDSLNNIVEEQTKTVSIPYSGTFGVEFNWIPTVSGDYKAVVSTEVTDAKCLSSVKSSTSKNFTVLSEEPRNMCYTLLNGLYISDHFPLENETITISGTKISNHVDTAGIVYTPVPTNLSFYILDSDGLLADSGSVLLPENSNPVDAKPFDFDYTVNGVGAYGLVVTAVAQSSMCDGLTNLPEVIGLDLSVQSSNDTLNQPPVIEGLPDLEINESETPPSDWIDLWQYASDAESSDDELQFSIVSQSNLGLINCRVDEDRYINCDLSADSYGFSDITIEVTDGRHIDRDSFRITVNEVVNRPLISNIPNINFDEDSSAIVDLDDYVTDPDNNVSELSWNFSGNTHVHINIDSNHVATFTADRDWYGVEIVVFTVTDPNGNSDSDNVVVTVYELDDDPVISNIPNINFNEDSSTILDLNNYVNDPNNNVNELSWNFSGNNHVHISIDSNHVATFTADRNWFGTETVVFTVSDPDCNSDSANVVVNVGEMDDSPVINISHISFNEGGYTTLNLNDYVTDPDNNVSELSWSVGGNNHVQISIDNRIATFTADAEWFGSETVVFTVTDPDGNSDSANVVVDVVNINDGPVISNIPDMYLEVKEETKIDLNDYVTDVDNHDSELSWSYKASRDVEVSINQNNIAIIKSKTKLGKFSITFTVNDIDGLVASDICYVYVSYVQKNSDLMLDTVKIVNEFLRPGDDLVIDVGLRNSGYLDFDGVRISVLVYDLGVGYAATSFDLDERDNVYEKVYLHIPEDTPRGVYDVRIVVSNDDIRRVINREFIVI